MNNLPDRAQIIPGSDAEFKVFLVDENGHCVDLAPYNAGKIIFCNCDGVRSEVVLTVPGANPGKGQLDVLVPSTDTAIADDKWESADIELEKTAGGTTVVILENKFEIINRICPPVA